MAQFIAISGPSVSGKTSLINSICSYPEFYRSAFSPDFKDVVWRELSESGIFSTFTDITTDSGYMCTYLHRLVDTYNSYIESQEDFPGLVILDECWVDYFIYAALSMWYTRVISSAQEEVFSKILKYKDKISRYYFTTAADAKYPPDKFRIRGRITTFKMNRPLEVKLYEAYSMIKDVVLLPHADSAGDSLLVLEDLKKVGYL